MCSERYTVLVESESGYIYRTVYAYLSVRKQIYTVDGKHFYLNQNAGIYSGRYTDFFSSESGYIHRIIYICI